MMNNDPQQKLQMAWQVHTEQTLRVGYLAGKSGELSLQMCHRAVTTL